MLPILLSVLFLLFLIFPQVISSGAAEGLLAWYQNVLPQLFPYMVLTGLMMKTSAATQIAAFFYPVLGRLFRLSIPGTYGLLCGLLCGYPMGAAVTAKLHRSGKISREEFVYLLSFCNLPGPSFLVGYLFHQCYPHPALPLPLVIVIFYLADFFISLLSRHIYLPKKQSSSPDQNSPGCTIPQALNEAVNEAMVTQLQICGCMIFYSGCTAMLLYGLSCTGTILPKPVFYLVGAIPEITSGIRRLSAWSQSILSLSIACGLCAFGGISVAAQTYHVLSQESKKTRQPFYGYLVWKTLYGILVFVLLLGIFFLLRSLGLCGGRLF